MKLHERHGPMTRARLEIGAAICAAVEKHDLTHGELWSILSQIGADWSKWAVRDERSVSTPAQDDEAPHV